MANIKSAIKRNKQNIKRNERNRMQRSALRTEIKKFLLLLAQSNLEDAKASLSGLHKIIDKAQAKGHLKKNTASRKKSRLTSSLNKLLQAQ